MTTRLVVVVVHSVVERRLMVPPGVAPVTNRKRLRA